MLALQAELQESREAAAQAAKAAATEAADHAATMESAQDEAALESRRQVQAMQGDMLESREAARQAAFRAAAAMDAADDAFDEAPVVQEGLEEELATARAELASAAERTDECEAELAMLQVRARHRLCGDGVGWGVTGRWLLGVGLDACFACLFAGWLASLHRVGMLAGWALPFQFWHNALTLASQASSLLIPLPLRLQHTQASTATPNQTTTTGARQRPGSQLEGAAAQAAPGASSCGAPSRGCWRWLACGWRWLR